MKEPVIITLDIETSYLVATTWGPKYEANLLDVIQHQQILSFSIKYLKGKQITKGLSDYKGYRGSVLNDKLLVQDLWNFLNEADVVVGQNLKDYDLKIINSRFAFYGLTPPAPFKVVDTRNEARKYLRLPSNSLDDLSKYFGLGTKLKHHGLELWTECIAGVKSSWKLMKSYNAHDTALTEKLYLKLLPWISTHPNVGMFTDKVACSRCGSGKLQSRGTVVNSTTKYRRLCCASCGGWMRIGSNIGEVKPTVSL